METISKYKAKGEALSEDEFASEVRTLLMGSASFAYGDISTQRTMAMDYYMGRPFGNEVRGRSQVVSTDVADTVEGILPYLMKIFTGSDRVVEVDATREDTVDLAEQATDYLNWLFYKKNQGFLVLYEFFKDALLQKNGIIKVWRQEDHKVETALWKGLTLPEVTFLLQDSAYEVLDSATYKDAQTGEDLYDIRARHTETEGSIRFKCVPPEEFVVNRRHNSLFLQDANLVCHRSRQTYSDLVVMGFDTDLLDDCADADDWLMSTEEMARDVDNAATMGDETDYGTTKGVYLLDEIYVRIDKDGDGIAELYKMFMIGDKLLDYEETDHIPFAAITPIIMTHRFHGRSVAELLMDIQLIKSTIQRESLDNLYQTNRPRMAVLRNMVNLQDLQEVRPNGIVRMDQLDAVTPLTVPFVARESFQVLQYFDDVKENRTGLTRYNQGMDANTLNKTATGISRIMDASKERIELIARIFAETGVGEAFRLALRLAPEGNSRVEIIKLRGKYIPIDPTEFKELTSLTINVGLGTGNKQEEIQTLNMIMGYQKEAMGMGMIKPINFYNSLEQLITLSGRKDISRYFQKPDPNAEMPQQKSESQQKIEAQVQMHQMDLQAQAQENIQKANIEADVTKFRISTQADSELATAKARAQIDMEARLYSEAMKLAAGLIVKPGTVNGAAPGEPTMSVDGVASNIMKVAQHFLPEHMRGQPGPATQ